MMGELIYDDSNVNKNSCEVKKINKGVYVVGITTENKYQFKKILIY